MSSISGSMEKKSQDKLQTGTPKGKEKKVAELEEYYKHEKVKTSTHCFVIEEVLAAKALVFFKENL